MCIPLADFRACQRASADVGALRLKENLYKEARGKLKIERDKRALALGQLKEIRLHFDRERTHNGALRKKNRELEQRALSAENSRWWMLGGGVVVGVLAMIALSAVL